MSSDVTTKHSFVAIGTHHPFSALAIICSRRPHTLATLYTSCLGAYTRYFDLLHFVLLTTVFLLLFNLVLSMNPFGRVLCFGYYYLKFIIICFV